MPYYLLINQLRRVQAISANCKQASGLACPVNPGHLQSISEPITTGCTRLVHQVDLDSEAAFASPADAASPFASAGFPFSADCDDRIESGCWTDLVGAWCIRKRTRAPPMTRNTNDSHRRVCLRSSHRFGWFDRADTGPPPWTSLCHGYSCKGRVNVLATSRPRRLSTLGARNLSTHSVLAIVVDDSQSMSYQLSMV